MSYNKEAGYEYITTITDSIINMNNVIEDIVEENWQGRKDAKKKLIFQLVSIDKLESDEDIKATLRHLQKLNVSANNLSEIKLKSYLKLAEIYAQKNQIRSVELKLPSLIKLDLSRNNINQLFELIDLPNLQELILSQNSIEEIAYDQLKYVKNSLQILDLSDNMIDFQDVSYFFRCFDNMGMYMKALNVLNLINNPFTKSNKYRNHYATYIQSACPVIQFLNGKDIRMALDASNSKADLKGIKERMILLEQTEDEEQEKPKVKNKASNVTLQSINKLMQKMNEYDLMNEKSINDLEQNIYIYLHNPSNAKEEEGLIDTDLDDFELFLDSFEKIIESVTKERVKNMYRILASFGLIRNGKFSSRALSFIKQSICADNFEQIQCGIDVIYNFICSSNYSQIPINLIESLTLFLDEPNFIAAMQLILKKLIQYTKEVSKKVAVEKQRLNDNDLRVYGTNMNIYNSLIKFIAKAIQKPEFENEVIKYDFIYECITNSKHFMNNSDEDIIQDDTLLSVICNLLLIVKVTAIKKVAELLSALTGSGIRDRLEQRLGLSLKSILGRTALDESSKNMKKRKQEFKRKNLIVAFICCFGALLLCSEDISRFLSNTNISMKIVEILSQKDFADPLVIHGACDFTYYFLQNDALIKSESDFSLISSKLYNLRYLMPLLFPNKPEFLRICKVADAFGDNVIERGKPISLQYMDSPIINDLFISMTRLMSIFGKYSKLNLPISAKCQDICDEMNNLERDTGLTYILTLPNEDVKLSVLECFYSVDINSLDPEELINIYKQIKNLSSMSSKMQYVVSIMILILNKWFTSNLLNKSFDKIETCKEAIFIAMNILCKNVLSKSAYETLNKNKTYLSAMIAIFLINISTFKETKKYFEDPKKKEELIAYLSSEEGCSKHMNVGFPLEFEKCYSGWSIMDYVYALKSEVIFPYNYVSIRVLIHIADVLANRVYPIYHLDMALPIDQHMEKLVNEMKLREVKRIKEEGMNWREVYAFKSSEQYVVKLTAEQLAKEQKAFIQNYNVFLDFMYGQLSSKRISEMNKIWKTKLSKDIDSVVYSLTENPKDSNEQNISDDEAETEADNLVEGEGKKEAKDNSNSNSTELYPVLLYFLRREDYNKSKVVSSNDLFAYITNELFSYHRYGYEPTLIREFSEETPNNPYIRSLSVSAFLRCIYSILEYAVNKEDKENLILILYSQDNIKKLCQLAECTKLTDNFIATKLFVVLRHLLRNVHLYLMAMNNNKTKRRAELNNEFLAKLGHIGYMIKRTIKLYKKELSLEKDDHKILLSELCQCCLMMITQLRLLPFESDEIKEKTILKMIDFEVIRVLIQMIKNYMNKEAESKGNVDNAGNKLLEEMVFVNITIIGEYMASCESRRYDILESFTRAYTFERCKLRKTIIKEILNNCICSKQKNTLLMQLKDANCSTLNLIAPCYIAFNRENGNDIISGTYTLAVSDHMLEFFEIDDLDSFYRQEKMDRKKELAVNIDNIKAILLFEFSNRCVIETENEYIIFFFYRINFSFDLKKLLKEINHKIEVFETVGIFTKELSGDTAGNEGNSKAVMISCKYTEHSACNIFNVIFKKKAVNKDCCVLTIIDGQIRIYVEDLDQWNELNYSQIFSNARFYKKGVNFMYLGTMFEECYEQTNVCYDVSEFDTIKIVENNQVLLAKGGAKGYTHYDVIQIFDDGSYVRLKNALKYYEDFDVYDNN